MAETPATASETALLGREAEQAAIERAVAQARLGRSETLVLSGEPGIGKTALLCWAEERARAERMEVLAARGVESETGVPFGGLLELLRPALEEIGQIPPAQAEALRGALDLGPSAERDRFLVGAATLNLLSARSAGVPLLVIVDDAHWLDDSSLAAILFAARRLVVDPVAVLFAMRPEQSPRLDAARLPQLPLTGVDAEAAAAIVAANAATAPPPEVSRRLGAAGGGNPLVLVQLAQRADELLAGPLDLPPATNTAIEGEFGRRIEALPDAARRALALAAAEQSGRLAWIETAAGELGLRLADLEPGEGAGLVSISFGGLAWSHPLARSAAYGAASGEERRAIHAALAAALPAEEADRRAWHLAAAALGADEEAATAVEEASQRARAKGAYAEAAGAAAHAAQLSADDSARARRLFAAAEAAWLGGDARHTTARLDEALELAAEPRLRAEIERLRGQAALLGGDALGGHAALVRAADEVAELDPAKAVVMLAEATDACVYAGRPQPMLAAARRAYELLPAEAEGSERFCASLALGTALIWNGEGEDGSEKVREALAVLEESEDLARDPRLLYAAALGPLWLREAQPGPPMIERAIAAARAEGALGILPFALALAARDAASGERWAIGRALYEEAIALGRDTDQAMPLCAALAGIASLLARTGEEERCREHADEALELAAAYELGLFRLWALEGLAELELGAGRLDAAAARLQEKQQALDELGLTDPDLSPVPELVEVAVRGGPAATAGALEAFVPAAEAKQQPWALARLARSRALLAESNAYAEHFDAALDLHRATPDRFEEARTRLCFGERLRRDGQRLEAREQLRPALESFEALHAAPWAERARTELLASGERARRRDPSTLDDLTPQELQIGLTLAAGLTTKEAAAKHFLSPKTVEYHLRNAYRKLGIRSREELAERLSEREALPPP